MPDIPLGAKIKKYRQRLGLSQLGLEVAIDAAEGSISRIESGKVNPTKETLIKISKILKLSRSEFQYLMEFGSEAVTKDEVNHAISEVAHIFDRDGFMGYLLDDRWKVWKASKYLMQLLNLSSQKELELQGEDVLSFLFNPNSLLHKFLNKEHLVEMAEFQLARLLSIREAHPFETWTQALIDKYAHLEIVQTALSSNIKNNTKPHYTSDGRTVYFNFGGNKVPMVYARENLSENPRFTLVEYRQVT